MTCDPIKCGGCEDSIYKCFDSFNLQEGSRVSFKGFGDDQIHVGIISSIEENKETGEIVLTCDQFPDPKPGLEAFWGDLID